ncbi:DUF7097 family protein [Halomicrobium salinisoli]|uniref:DUF7097 family protein n=1 Tax=Halomicrobium salinisoli TaxID=2878391 RepID=UPI001CF007BD|nr:hypothetical protein [Halomicrobium salinisoli]
MEKAPGGTSVGVDDPYEHVDRCDFVTDEGQCRWAVEHGRRDPEFADERSAEDFRCPVVSPPDGESVPDTEDAPRRGDGGDLPGEWRWSDCPHFRCRQHDRECARCGLEERRMAHSDERPLLEEHHLSYSRDSGAGDGDAAHEVTVYLCRWCHAKVHGSWARIDDDANPDPEAVAEKEGRKSRELDEMGFESAAERFEDDE